VLTIYRKTFLTRNEDKLSGQKFKNLYNQADGLYESWAMDNLAAAYLDVEIGLVNYGAGDV
jgi:hypothetical protein